MQNFLRETIREAGAIAKEYFARGVSYAEKSNASDLVTEADTAVSDFLIRKIHEAYPDHRIHSEELKEDVNGDSDAEYEWLIDPIDGTRNFALAISVWCNIIAVYKKGELFLGGIYNPIADELFFAEAGKGAFLNGKPIRVNGKADFHYSCGAFSSAKEAGAVYGTHIDRFKHFADRLNHETVTWIHSFGTMLGGCYVANGGMDFFVQNAGLDHDYAAAVLLAREAGGVVTDSDGNPWQRGRQDIVVANPNLHPKVMELFK